MVPAETGSESATVVNAAAVNVSKIFMGIISIEDPSPPNQRLRREPGCIATDGLPFFNLSEVEARKSENAAHGISSKRSRVCVFGARAANPSRSAGVPLGQRGGITSTFWLLTCERFFFFT